MRISPLIPIHRRGILIIFLILLFPLGIFAQGRSIPRSSKVEEETQTTSPKEEELPEGVKYRYPLFNGISLMFNVFEPVLDLFAKDYSSYETTIMFDLHHRFFPEASFGVGYCNEKSDDLVHYEVKTTPFYKIGFRYNLNYNDLEDKFYYFIVARYGFCHSEADISNLSYKDGYWPEYGPISIRDQEFNSHWVEIGGGIKVQIWDRLSAGWDFYIKPFISKGSTRNAEPYYIPGYGTTGSNFGMAFRLYYDLF